MLASRGGIRIGCFYAMWPFARLSVKPGQLTLDVMWSGEFSFFPGQVVHIESIPGLPLVHRGIRITHTARRFPETIVFLCSTAPDELIARIHAEGFQPQGARDDVPERTHDFPVAGKAIAAAIAVWNIPLLFSRLGLASLFGVALLFAGAIGIGRSARLQSFVVKPGRNMDEIRDVLMTVEWLTGFLMLLFILLILTGIF